MQGLSWKTDSFLAGQDIFWFCRTWRFCTVFTKAYLFIHQRPVESSTPSHHIFNIHFTSNTILLIYFFVSSVFCTTFSMHVRLHALFVLFFFSLSLKKYYRKSKSFEAPWDIISFLSQLLSLSEGPMLSWTLCSQTYPEKEGGRRERDRD
jgi:hypothetical protein